MVHSIGDLKLIASEAGGSAARTVEASVYADSEASKTTQTTREAIEGILSLVREIQQAAEVIEAQFTSHASLRPPRRAETWLRT